MKNALLYSLLGIMITGFANATDNTSTISGQIKGKSTIEGETDCNVPFALICPKDEYTNEKCVYADEKGNFKLTTDKTEIRVSVLGAKVDFEKVENLTSNNVIVLQSDTQNGYTICDSVVNKPNHLSESEVKSARHCDKQYLINGIDQGFFIHDKCLPTKCATSTSTDELHKSMYTLVGQKNATECPDKINRALQACMYENAKCEPVSGDCKATLQAEFPNKDISNATIEWRQMVEDPNTAECTYTCPEKFIRTELTDDNETMLCKPASRECTNTELNEIPGATAGMYDETEHKCFATKCGPGYNDIPKKGVCESLDGTKCKNPPAHAKSSHMEYNKTTGAAECIVDSCDDKCNVSNDKKSCMCPELDDEDAQNRIKELTENAQKMHDKENSTANKMIGAAGMAATGIGGMQLMSGMAEKSADEAAERDMRAYLATFRCDFGSGRSINGGDKNVELPTSPELMPLVNQYKELASTLKISKEALGMTPGIESEVVIDAATTGLYDDVGVGRKPGAFTSLYRALTDENSADAQAWAEQKQAAQKKMKTGAIVAGVGAAGSLAANLAVNSGKDKQDQSKKIMQKYEQRKKIAVDSSLSRKSCSDLQYTIGGGYIPNCQCDAQHYYDVNQGCISCGSNETQNPQKNGCECQNGYYPNANGVCTYRGGNCPLTGFTKTDGSCDCQPNATKSGNRCECDKAGYRANGNLCQECNLGEHAKADNKCECADGYTEQNGTCQSNDTTDAAKADAVPSTALLFTTGNDLTFGTNKNTISNADCAKLANAIKTNDEYKKAKEKWDSNSTKNACIIIFGKTDKTGQYDYNIQLSTKRADAMATCIEKHFKSDLSNPEIRKYGVGPNLCTKNGNQPECRQTDININFGKCDEEGKDSTATDSLKKMMKDLGGEDGKGIINLLGGVAGGAASQK